MAILLYALLLVSAAAAQPVEILNVHGDVNVEIEPGERLRAWRAGSAPDSMKGIAVSRSPTRLLIEALPPEGDELAGMEVRVPLGVSFTVRTEDGPIRVAGMVRRARLISPRGSVTLAVPLDVTRLNLDTLDRPPSISLAPRRGMGVQSVPLGRSRRIWKLSSEPRSRDLLYGLVEGQLQSPPALTVRDWPIPRDWPLKPHTLSPAAVQRLLDSANRRRSPGSQPQRRPAAPLPADTVDSSQAGALFTSEVRMVSMSVAVSDSGGRPMTGLGKEDFVVDEEGKRQDIRVVDPEESPFNLAILLDLSGSTSVDLEHMRQATIRLIEMAGPKDRVSLYAMSGSLFHRLTRLTSDRDVLLERCQRLPYPAGGSPLWDVIALVYDDELARHAGERNALVVISDGIDNRISGQSVPSMLRAAKLTEAAGEMDARIYPLFLLSGERFGRNWSSKARARMTALAQATGGRLFTAKSIADIEPVLPQLAREMRSVYEIAYYPANQDFDGDWRRVRIKVSLPGARVRARPGYFAD